jgi:hypothetical protein
MNRIKLALAIGLMVSGSVYATGFNNGGSGALGLATIRRRRTLIVA